jgi:hypothetical protein
MSAPPHAQLGVHARHDHVEPLQQLGLLVERAVQVDVHLDAGQDPERRQPLVELVHLRQLPLQPLGRQPLGDGQPRRVVGQRPVLVPERDGRLGHLLDRRAAVRPVRVAVQVAFERGPQRGGLGVQLDSGGGPHPSQVRRNLAIQAFVHYKGGDLADARQVAEPAGAGQPHELVPGEAGDDRGGAAEGAHAVRRLAGALQQEGDLAQRLDRIHAFSHTQASRNRRQLHIEQGQRPPLG